MILPPLTPALSPRRGEREHHAARGDAAPGRRVHRNAADFCQLTPDCCP